MADDRLAEHVHARASWTKLFTAFRVALDLKKLLLAAGGLVATAFGWWLFALLFYNTAAIPQWEHYSAAADNKQEAWQTFKRDRARWNLLHEMAGEIPGRGEKVIREDTADVADSLEEFMLLEDVRTKTKTLDQLRAEAAGADDHAKAARAALESYTRHLIAPVKPVGRLRSWPWNEDRGPNQYLLVEGLLRKDAEGLRTVPWARGEFFRWLLEKQLPVLIEPLMKFLAPIGYIFNPAATGFRNRLYLLLVILWTIAVWGFFGGAICRIAAVQIAKNEKISLREARGFATEKFLNLFTAPLFPLIFLGILTIFLLIFGLIEGFIPWFGDIFIAGLLWPIVIVLGLIMAVVLVGLSGWPLMNPTIAAEGSDNFDALSRSYSYVYQALWHYLAYWGLALLYGAALVFFVGFMGSLVVYLGKWGVSQAPGLRSSDPTRDRDPAYLFLHAPTSFGWRDLLIKDSLHVERESAVGAHAGAASYETRSYEFKDEYLKALSAPNRIGAVMVGFWVGLFFLLVVGFAYSYFWTAATIIYFLMRQHVDDTEFEEVYFEEGDLEAPPSSMPPSPPPAAAKPNTVSLNVVEGGATAASPGLPPQPVPPPEPPPPPPPANPT